MFEFDDTLEDVLVFDLISFKSDPAWTRAPETALPGSSDYLGDGIWALEVGEENTVKVSGDLRAV